MFYCYNILLYNIGIQNIGYQFFLNTAHCDLQNIFMTNVSAMKLEDK